jgi:hypothetical protein
MLKSSGYFELDMGPVPHSPRTWLLKLSSIENRHRLTKTPSPLRRKAKFIYLKSLTLNK